MNNNDLPIYESEVKTAEEREAIFKMVSEQSRLFIDQGKNGTPLKFIKVRCPCMKLVGLLHGSYKCLYCGIYFCTDCAERHFGKRKPPITIG
jgi:hypothetical protein